jgi:hypothetical protein
MDKVIYIPAESSFVADPQAAGRLAGRDRPLCREFDIVLLELICMAYLASLPSKEG